MALHTLLSLSIFICLLYVILLIRVLHVLTGSRDKAPNVPVYHTKQFDYAQENPGFG
jgi:hypothetical protein